MSIICYSQSGLCDPTVPFFVVDLASDPNANFIQYNPNKARNTTCCGKTNTDCIEFEVTLHPNALGFSFEAIGATATGSLEYQIDCGPPYRSGEVACVNGTGPFTVTFCKPGGNGYDYQIQSIAGIAEVTDTTIIEGCNTILEVSGNIDYSTITWNDITSGSGAYNANLSCTAACTSTVFTPSTDMPSLIEYEVCAMPVSADCPVLVEVCDTLDVVVLPPFDVNLTNTTFCQNSANNYGVSVVASIIAYPYDFEWYNGYDATGTLLSTSSIFNMPATGSYSVKVTHNIYGECASIIKNFDGVIYPSPKVNVGPDFKVCISDTINLNSIASGGDGNYSFLWDSGETSDFLSVYPPLWKTYTVTVTDGNQCTASDAVVVVITACTEDCSNGIDDDYDGLVDCEDEDCDCCFAKSPVLSKN